MVDFGFCKRILWPKCSGRDIPVPTALHPASFQRRARHMDAVLDLRDLQATRHCCPYFDGAGRGGEEEEILLQAP